MRAKGGFYEKLCAYNKRRWVNLKFCHADLVYLIQELRSDCVHLSNKYAKIVIPSARFINEINKIRGTELWTYPSFRYKHIPSLKNLPSTALNESLPYWFQGNFAASFVLNFCLRELLLFPNANLFELRCEPKQVVKVQCFESCEVYPHKRSLVKLQIGPKSLQDRNE